MSNPVINQQVKLAAIEQFLRNDAEAPREAANNIYKLPQTSSIIADEPIAIIGLAGNLPQCQSIPQFWQALDRNQPLVEEIPRSRFNIDDFYDPSGKDPNKMRTKWGGFIPNVFDFDPTFFDVLPSKTAQLDPRQRLLLMATYHSIEDAGYSPSSWKRSNTGVFVAAEENEHLRTLREWGFPLENDFSNAPTLLANSISYFFDFHGPSESINTMCSGSAVALHKAVQSLRIGEIDQAVVASANLLLRPELFILLSRYGQMSPICSVKSFGNNAQGYLRSEGAISVVLKSLSKAEKDGDPIYALIKNSAVNYNGRGGISIMAPNVATHTQVIEQCYKNIDPRDISYIEAQGMGNPVADIVEWQSFNKALKNLANKHGVQLEEGQCRVSTLKPLLGHMHSTSALGAMLKIIRGFQINKIHKIIDFDGSNADITLEKQCCQLVTETQDWLPGEKPRLAGLHSYGTGGNNAHILLEEYLTAKRSNKISSEAVLLPFSAASGPQNREQIRLLKEHIEANPELALSDVAYTLQTGRDTMAAKMAFVASTREQWLLQAQEFLADADNSPGVIHTTYLDGMDTEQSRALVAAGERWVASGELPEVASQGVGKNERLHLPHYPFKLNPYPLTKPVKVKPHSDRGLGLHALFGKLSGPLRDFYARKYGEKAATSPANTGEDLTDKPDAPVKENQSTASTHLLEYIVRNLLSEYLQVSDDAVNLDTEFFALGLDSLSIIRLAASLQERFPFTVETSLFSEHPTPRKLIAFLNTQVKPHDNGPTQQNSGSQQGETTETHAAGQKRLLVPIQTKGRKRPIFAVPGAGASVFSFYPLVNALGNTQPFYALQALEPKLTNAGSNSLSYIAELSLEAIKAIQPEGPYQFIGHSLGGLVVYEMVTRLLDNNEKIASVTLLDAFAPKLFKPHPGSEAELLANLGNDLAALHNLDLSIDITELTNTPAGQRNLFIATKLKQHNLAINENQFSAFSQACQLAYGFEPKKLPHKVNISLCRAKASNKFSHLTPDDYGWQDLLADKLRVVEVEGDHFSMLDKDHIEHIIPHLNLTKTKE